jgi:hypothetical protein
VDQLVGIEKMRKKVDPADELFGSFEIYMTLEFDPQRQATSGARCLDVAKNTIIIKSTRRQTPPANANKKVIHTYLTIITRAQTSSCK